MKKCDFCIQNGRQSAILNRISAESELVRALMNIDKYKKFDEKISNGVDRRAYTVRNGRTDGRAALPSPPPSRRGRIRVHAMDGYPWTIKYLYL